MGPFVDNEKVAVRFHAYSLLYGTWHDMFVTFLSFNGMLLQ